MIVVAVRNSKGGPYTIHQMGNTFVAVSHFSPVINTEWSSTSEKAVIDKLVGAFGKDNVDILPFKQGLDACPVIQESLKKRVGTSM